MDQPDVPIGTEVSVSWGREHFQPVQFCGFDVGPFGMTVTTREGESARAATKRAMAILDFIAKEEFHRKLKDFLAKVREADRVAQSVM